MIGLQHRHRAVVEEEGVVVVGRAAEQLDIVGAVAETLLQKALHQRLRLLHANLEIVEGGVIVDILAAADQAVIGDDLDVGGGGILASAFESVVPSMAAITSTLAPLVIMFSTCASWLGMSSSAYCRSVW